MIKEKVLVEKESEYFKVFEQKEKRKNKIDRNKITRTGHKPKTKRKQTKHNYLEYDFSDEEEY